MSKEITNHDDYHDLSTQVPKGITLNTPLCWEESQKLVIQTNIQPPPPMEGYNINLLKDHVQMGQIIWEPTQWEFFSPFKEGESHLSVSTFCERTKFKVTANANILWAFIMYPHYIPQEYTRIGTILFLGSRFESGNCLPPVYLTLNYNGFCFKWSYVWENNILKPNYYVLVNPHLRFSE